jgi:hypothetical protein
MIHLILTVCSLSAPPDCVEQRLQIFDVETPMQCAMWAQPTIARWVVEHPQRRVARWRCAFPGYEEDPT